MVVPSAPPITATAHTRMRLDWRNTVQHNNRQIGRLMLESTREAEARQEIADKLHQKMDTC
jgi:hypothetical protein